MNRFSILLVPLMSVLLVSAQAFWGSFVKSGDPLHGSFTQITTRVLSSPKVWIGALLYLAATATYFALLSRYKFFVVQIVMAGLAIVFSTGLSYLLFHERITIPNVAGMVFVFIGICLVFLP